MIKISSVNIARRLDVFLSNHFKDGGYPQLTRSVLKTNWNNLVKVNGKFQKAGYKLKLNDIVEIDSALVKELVENIKDISGIKAQEGDLDIAFEDEEFLVILKQKAVVVHPGVGHRENTLANKVRGYLEAKGEFDTRVKRAGVVHRLDKSVSGLIVFAKTYEAQRHLQKQFEEHLVKKVYLAKVEYSKLRADIKKYFPEEPVNLSKELDKISSKDFKLDSTWYKVAGYIRRSSRSRVKMEFRSYSSNNAKNALTYIKPLGQEKLLIMIHTGRMHQIRATLEYLEMNIVGDTLYGQGFSKSMPEEIELESVLLGFKDMDGNDLVIKNV
jgi:23S rRNA-/tRNA-specific pseudouridylate synthase